MFNIYMYRGLRALTTPNSTSNLSSPTSLMTSSTTNEAALSLKFVVVGGGIAGLATAFALQRAGHSVLVLEKRDPNSMGFGAGGGIRAPPNMTRLLYRWGLGPMLREKGTRCNRITYVNGNSAGMLGAILFNEAFIKALIADMILIQHGDLLNILYDLALREGVEIRHNANVVHTDPDCATVRLDTGETLSGDIIVLADGFTSSLRFNVTGYCQDAGLESHEQVLLVAFTVDTKLLQDDESFKPVLDPTQWMTWIAEDNILHTYIVNGGELLIGALSHDYSGPLREGDEEWREDRDLASYGLDFSALEPRMQKMFKLAKTVASRTFLKSPVPDDFVNDRSSIVLVGEAAHPLVPEGSHGTALAIEDAVTLGSLFSRIQCREQINQLLMGYEEIRHPRCVRTYDHHKRLDQVMKFPIGPQQEARDAVLHECLAFGDWDHMDAEVFRATWGDHLTSFAYDAQEAVDDWWYKWGPFITHAKEEDKQGKSMWTGLQIWISQE